MAQGRSNAAICRSLGLGAKTVEARGEAKGSAAAVAVSAEILTDADIDRLIEERAAARKAKNFKESDRIRELLATTGVVLEDLPGGKTLWRRG